MTLDYVLDGGLDDVDDVLDQCNGGGGGGGERKRGGGGGREGIESSRESRVESRIIYLNLVTYMDKIETM